MVTRTLVYSALLILVGFSSYSVSDSKHFTASIPAIIGGIFLLLAWWQSASTQGKLSIGVALILALIVALGSIGGIPKVITLVMGGEVARPLAAFSQTITAILSVWYVLGGVSFLKGRTGEASV